MKRAELVIKGSKVINVGYRPYLLLNAMYLGVEKFFAFNAREEDQETVIVRMQGEDCIIIEGFVMDTDKFLKLLQFEQISKAVTAIISIDKKLSESESKIS